MNRRIQWLTGGLVALLVCTAWAGSVAAQGTGDATVIGQVTNGTAGGALPFGAPVTLQFFGEGVWTQVYTTTLATDGIFRFEDLSAETGSDFLVHIVYQDVSYYSEPATLAGEVETSADISIFETTDDPSVVQVDQAHLFVVPAGDRVQIAEYYLIGSTGDRTFVGTSSDAEPAPTTVMFTVPSGAEMLSFDGLGLGERYIGDATGFADTLPIPPGTATLEVSFSYELDYREGLEISRALSVPAKSVVMIVNGSEVGLEGAGVAFSGMMDTQMGAAASYTAGPLAAGAPLLLRFVAQDNTTAAASGAAPPVTSATPRQRNPGGELAVGVVALAVGSLVGYQVWRSQTVPPMPERAQGVVLQIVALDEQYDAGGLEDSDYRREREVLRAKARTIIQRSR